MNITFIASRVCVANAAIIAAIAISSSGVFLVNWRFVSGTSNGSGSASAICVGKFSQFFYFIWYFIYCCLDYII